MANPTATTEVKLASVGLAGSGGTPGNAILLGTTGVGRKVAVVGTISASGALTSVALLDSGAYSTAPTLPSGEPVSGGGLVGATLILNMSDPLEFSSIPGPYTVATLPTMTGVGAGTQAYVTDATAPIYNGVLTGGGAVACNVWWNGTAWLST